MKYKKILIFLILCLLIVSATLIAYIYLSKANLNEYKENDENKVNQNTNIAENHIVAQNLSNINNTIVQENIVENINVQENDDKKEKNENQEKSHIEEQSSEKEEITQDNEQIALKLVKDEWGEDDSVYYTVDRQVENIYYISVRGKANTQSLMEYEVDIEKKTVEMK